MDNLINLEMLFWAAENGGRPEYAEIARSHAGTTMKYNFRPDGTSYHVAVYDPETGRHIRSCTHQGYSDSSMWARGQAWGIYGYTMCYRFTKDRKYLDFACKIADVYLSKLPEDLIPYWDFNDPAIPDAPRDASAAAVVASALIELSGYAEGEKDRLRHHLCGLLLHRSADAAQGARREGIKMAAVSATEVARQYCQRKQIKRLICFPLILKYYLCKYKLIDYGSTD